MDIGINCPEVHSSTIEIKSFSEFCFDILIGLMPLYYIIGLIGFILMLGCIGAWIIGYYSKLRNKGMFYDKEEGSLK